MSVGFASRFTSRSASCFASRSAIAIMKCETGGIHGTVKIQEVSYKGPLRFTVQISNIQPGLHGFHIHASGNDLMGPDGLCSHYNPMGAKHGGRNDPNAHRGDLGNIYVDSNGQANETFVANLLRYDDIIGRGLVVHDHEDDLGRGSFDDSTTTGHSGKRILWGSIVRDEPCH